MTIGVGVLVPDGIGRHWLELVTAPTVYPWSLEYVRDEHLKVSSGDLEDAYIAGLMAAAFRWAEQFTHCALGEQSWRWHLDRFPAGGCGIVLPYPPLLEVTAISYLDDAGDRVVWGGGSPWPYDVLAPSGPRASRAEIIPAYGESWPAARVHAGSVRVEWTAGFAAGSPSEVPAAISAAMLLVIAELYKQRSQSVHAFSQNPAIMRAENLLRPYVIE